MASIVPFQIWHEHDSTRVDAVGWNVFQLVYLDWPIELFCFLQLTSVSRMGIARPWLTARTGSAAHNGPLSMSPLRKTAADLTRRNGPPDGQMTETAATG